LTRGPKEKGIIERGGGGRRGGAGVGNEILPKARKNAKGPLRVGGARKRQKVDL